MQRTPAFVCWEVEKVSASKFMLAHEIAGNFQSAYCDDGLTRSCATEKSSGADILMTASFIPSKDWRRST